VHSAAFNRGGNREAKVRGAERSERKRRRLFGRERE
jgi:hypothetical protein